ncbi:MAG: Modulator of FtsH protease HflK [bacterium ADurb.Bin429]|nr:MAG: Modulator of FtsH protease HflK [bacterium ADurb.Bin429]
MSTDLPPVLEMPTRAYAAPTDTHVSLGRGLRALLFWIPAIVVGLILFGIVGRGTLSQGIAVIYLVLFAIVWYAMVSAVRVAAQWERGIVLRLGRFQGVRGPGFILVIPVIEFVRFVDLRTLVLNIPRQRVITLDNVPAQIDAALFFRVVDIERAVLEVQDFRFAIAQYAQGALRDVVGSLTLDELLSEREQIQERIKLVVEERVQAWGMHVETIRMQDIELPEDLKRVMSRQASAEREKRATITKAEGDKMAAMNLSEAAATMLQSPGAMQLRVLQSVDGLGTSPSNTVILFPVEWVHIVQELERLWRRESPPEETE